MPEYTIKIRTPHGLQRCFIESDAKRKIVRAGRRGGKTVGMAILAVQTFLAGKRVLYAGPTMDQVGRFWSEVTTSLIEPVTAGLFRQNVTEHIIELPGTSQRIRAKTAFNADTLRGDWADLLILDEYQLMSEDAWGTVGAPMLLDRDGDAVFVFTPPSLHNRSASKSNDPQHAAKLYRAHQDDPPSSRWKCFHFRSTDNPHISSEALDEISKDMTAVAYRQEILAEDIDEAPGAMWTRKVIEDHRVAAAPALLRIVVAVDPSASSVGDEAGIVTVATGEDGRLYVLADNSLQGSPATWAATAVDEYNHWQASYIVAEANQGGEMVREVIAHADRKVPVKLVHAARGKDIRAEPVSAAYEHDRVSHVGTFSKLEDEMSLWTPGDPSPNRLDALVWACKELLGIGEGQHTDGELLDRAAYTWRVK